MLDCSSAYVVIVIAPTAFLRHNPVLQWSLS
jgi:hypothetical protein